jgi:hypothetical protein
LCVAHRFVFSADVFRFLSSPQRLNAAFRASSVKHCLDDGPPSFWYFSDDFIAVFNTERPHEALGMKYPAEVYRLSPRVYRGLPELDYPFHDKIIVVTRHLAGQLYGLRSGIFRSGNPGAGTFTEPFGSKVLPMS